MIAMQLKRAFGSYRAGSILLFEAATSNDVLPNDVVLCGLNEKELFPHIVMPDGDLSSFGYIVGELCNIRYKVAFVEPAA